ncbi:hypothetical protein FIBSPDRAFT_853239 [Athelia psychrophila]|uniref:Protein kinase domain-containing protein n=1 Tax=Athelia psychrophila TaxID=1759441 RepID=A0A166QWZ7_9AGAM|nr:hypothetical protein FIBSPDRAFT_853239 [Fibularhizoctonia sp. CBS 109695]
MDVFSGRCVIAELFLEGAPSSTPSQLFKYREGELSGDGTLGAIADEGVEMIKQMINLDPSLHTAYLRHGISHSARARVCPPRMLLLFLGRLMCPQSTIRPPLPLLFLSAPTALRRSLFDGNRCTFNRTINLFSVHHETHICICSCGWR